MHQRRVISLLIHGFLAVNARLLIAFGTAFYAIINCCHRVSAVRSLYQQLKSSMGDIMVSLIPTVYQQLKSSMGDIMVSLIPTV